MRPIIIPVFSCIAALIFHILHSGIIGYSNPETEASYQFLVRCIAIIMISFRRRNDKNFRQTVFQLIKKNDYE